jgi:integrase
MRKRPGIYKRGKTYWITYTWRGRQYFESSHSPEIQDAESLLIKRKTELASGRIAVRQSETLTVEKLLTAYIAQIENPATQKRYRLSQSVLLPFCGSSRITDVDAFTFDRFKESRIKEGVSPAGVNRDIAVYRAAFNFAVGRRLLTHSPVDGVKLFNEAKLRKAPRVLSFAEEHRILMCCDQRLGTLVKLLLETGMRVGIEALKLKWADIDFEESLITVVQSKTTAGLRTLPMTPLVKSALLDWRAATNGISEYVFFNPQRTTLHIRSVKKAWHKALKVAGLPPFPIYQCRHTHATRLAASGVSDTIIDQLLGHSRRDVLRFYTARVLDYLRDAISRLHQFRIAKSELSGRPVIEAVDEPSLQKPFVVH